MLEIKVKPLSINKAFVGRRFKTLDCKKYELEVLYQLPKIEVPQGKLKLEIVAGLSSRNADIDNVAKIFIDCLQKKYGFNDRDIYELNLKKEIVKKGEEFIKFNFKTNEKQRK